MAGAGRGTFVRRAGGVTDLRAVARRVGAHRALVALCAFALAKGVVWAALVPMWQAPDEPQHFGLAQALAFQQGEHRYSQSISAALLLTDAADISFHRDYAGVFAADERARRERALAELPVRSAAAGGDFYNERAYPLGYYWSLAAFLRVFGDSALLDLTFDVRMISVALSVLTLVLQYLALRLLLSDAVLAFCAALLLTLMPMYTFMESAINPEVVITLLFAALLYVAARAIRGTQDLRVSGLAGVLTGAGLLVKTSMLPAAPVFAILTVLSRRRGSLTPPRVLRHLLMFVAIVAGVAAWAQAEAAGFAATPFKAGKTADLVGEVLAALASGRSALQSYWAAFGWLDTTVPPAIDGVIGALSLVSMAGLAVIVARAAARRALDPGLALMLGATAAAAVFYLGVQLTTGIGLQGRYLFPVAPAIVGLQLIGLTGLLPELGRRVVAASLVSAMAALHVLALLGTVLPRYYL